MRVIFAIGQTVETDVPFDLGIDGVPLRLAGAVAPRGRVELRRRPRPQPQHRPVRRRQRRPTDRTTGRRARPARRHRPRRRRRRVLGRARRPVDAAVDADGSIIPGTWDDERCLGGQLAFLGVQVRDGDGATTRQQLVGRPRRRPRPEQRQRRHVRHQQHRRRQAAAGRRRSTPTSTCASAPASSAARRPGSRRSSARSTWPGAGARVTRSPHPTSTSTTSTSTSSRCSASSSSRSAARCARSPDRSSR